jgi:hypothetical protein
MTNATSDARPRKQHRVLTDLTRRHPGAMSPAPHRVTVDRPSLVAPSDQLTRVADRLHEILITGSLCGCGFRPSAERSHSR